MTKSALGPHGLNKMVINHLDKLFVTSDAATIIKESDVHHPAANMVKMAAKMQENECGDGTNFVLTLAGELMFHGGIADDPTKVADILPLFQHATRAEVTPGVLVGVLGYALGTLIGSLLFNLL